MDQDWLRDLMLLCAFGLTCAFVAVIICRLLRCTPRNIADAYFCVGFGVGAIPWTFKTSMRAGESKVHQLNHWDLGPADKAWCFLYDHLFALSVGAGVLVVLLGECLGWTRRRASTSDNAEGKCQLLTREGGSRVRETRVQLLKHLSTAYGGLKPRFGI